MRKRKTYNVTAKRWKRGWELHIDGVGVTQSHGLSDGETMARDYIAVDLDVPEDSFDVELHIEIGPKIDKLVGSARAAVKDAAVAQIMAAETSRGVVKELTECGLTGRDIAIVMGVSPQRVSQLAAEVKDLHHAPKKPSRSRSERAAAH